MQYELLEKQLESKLPLKKQKSPEESSRINSLIKLAGLFGESNKSLFQLLLFSKINDYIRFMILIQVYKNFNNVRDIRNRSMNEHIFESFMKLGVQLGLLFKENDTYSLSDDLIVSDKIMRKQLLSSKEADYPDAIKKIMNNYNFVLRAIAAEPDSSLYKIMDSNDFIYIKQVLLYLQEINSINFYQKISPSFSEDFYTDLGELAFNIYTKENYNRFISDKNFKQILDIGCGNGNYIDIHSGSSNKYIIGVERQKKVYTELKEKYKDKENVHIYNDDIINLTFENKFDMINISYMLFYLTHEEKLVLFKKIKQILHKEGSIIICQYYPDFSDYQELIARHDKQWNLISRFKYNICNNILQAEVLLNNMLDDFAQAEEWKPFLELLEQNDFEVSEITPADNTYYSYFITVKHKGRGSND